jgi:hypothetical protein
MRAFEQEVRGCFMLEAFFIIAADAVYSTVPCECKMLAYYCSTNVLRNHYGIIWYHEQVHR